MGEFMHFLIASVIIIPVVNSAVIALPWLVPRTDDDDHLGDSSCGMCDPSCIKHPVDNEQSVNGEP